MVDQEIRVLGDENIIANPKNSQKQYPLTFKAVPNVIVYGRKKADLNFTVPITEGTNFNFNLERTAIIFSDSFNLEEYSYIMVKNPFEEISDFFYVSSLEELDPTGKEFNEFNDEVVKWLRRLVNIISNRCMIFETTLFKDLNNFPNIKSGQTFIRTEDGWTGITIRDINSELDLIFNKYVEEVNKKIQEHQVKMNELLEQWKQDIQKYAENVKQYEIVRVVTQTGHGFVFEPVMYSISQRKFVKAVFPHGADGVAVRVDDNNFRLVWAGRVEIPVTAKDTQQRDFVLGEYYFLGEGSNGGIQREKPDTYYQHLFQVMYSEELRQNIADVLLSVPINQKGKRWDVGEAKTTVNDIEELKMSDFPVGKVIEVLGYYKAGDGADHKRIISATDDGSGVQLNNGLWANIVHNGEVNVSWFGAKGDGVTDDTEVIKKTINYCNIINFPKGNFLITDTLPNVQALKLIGKMENGYETLTGSNAEKITVFKFKPTSKKALMMFYKKSDGVNYIGRYVIKNILFDLSDVNAHGIQFGLAKLNDTSYVNDFSEMINWDTVVDGSGQDYIFGVQITDCNFRGEKTRNKIALTRIKCFDSKVENCCFVGFDIDNVKYGCDSPIDRDNYYTGNIGSVNYASGNFGVLYKEQDGWFTCNEISIFSGNNVMFLSDGNRTENTYTKDYTIKVTVNKDTNEITGNFDETQFRPNMTPFKIIGSEIGDMSCVIEKRNGKYYINNSLEFFSNETFDLTAIYSISEVSNKPYNYVCNNGSFDSRHGFSFVPNKRNAYRFNISNTNYTYGSLAKKEIYISSNYTQVYTDFEKNPIIDITNSNFYAKNHFLTKCFEIDKLADYIKLDSGNLIKDNMDNIKTYYKYNHSISEISIKIEKYGAWGDVRIVTPLCKEGFQHRIKVTFLNSLKTTGDTLSSLLVNKNGGVKTEVFKTSGKTIECFEFVTDLLNSSMALGSPMIYVSGTTKELQFLEMTIISEMKTQNVAQLNTLYHMEKMKQEGVYEDYISYMDEKTAYDKQQRKLEQDRQLAYEEALKENPELTYEEFMSVQPMTLNLVEEPQPSQALKKFMDKYL